MAKMESTADNGRMGGEGTSDPWSNRRAFDKLGLPSPVDVVAFTERRLLGEHWDAGMGGMGPRGDRYDKDIPRAFWELIQTCKLLKRLCARYSSKHFDAVTGYPSGHLDAVERLYVVIEILESFHRTGDRPEKLIQRGATIRKQQQRKWQAHWRGLKRSVDIVDCLPDLCIPEMVRRQVLAVLRPATEKAAQFTKNPPSPGVTIVFSQKSPSGKKIIKKEMLVLDPNLNPDPPKRGRFRDIGSLTFQFNLETALLDEFLLSITSGKRRWELLLDLLRHFNPSHFTDLSPHALRTRVQWFRKEHQEILQDHKQRYLSRGRHLIETSPV